MWNVIVCDDDQTEREQILSYIRCFCDENGETVQIKGCGEWQELAELVRLEEPSHVVVAQNGVKGLDTVTSARLLSGRILWFSDLDFGVQAYRLCVAYFCQKPVTGQKIGRALTQGVVETTGR